MASPTEILYWEILPAIRSQIVFELKNQNFKQKEIAQLLEVTPSAISQYLKAKRGSFEFNDEFLELIKKSTENISQKKSTVFEETNKLIKVFQKNKHLCIICSKKNNLNNCDICHN